MRRIAALIVVLLVLGAVSASAYTVSCSGQVDGSQATVVTFGTGQDKTILAAASPSFDFTMINPDAAPGTTGERCSQLFAQDCPGIWNMRYMPGSSGSQFLMKMWIVNPGNEPTSPWQLLANGNLVWEGGFPAAAGSSTNPLSQIVFDASGPIAFEFVKVVPEPASLCSLIGGLVGFAGVALRGRKR